MTGAWRTFWRGAVAAGVALALVVQSALPAAAQSRLSAIRDTEIESTIRGWSLPIIEAAGLDPRAVRFIYIADQSINAFVANGQNIYIFTGLITETDTPNELLGVIAHEAGHISGGHLARTSDAISQASVPLIVSFLVGLAAAAAGSPEAAQAAMLGGRQIAERSFLAFSRAQETQADQAAVSFLDAAGMSSEGLLTVMRKFADQELLSRRTQDPYVRTHPLSMDRIASLERRIAQSPFRDRTDTPAQIFAYAMIRAKISGFLDRPDIVLRRYPRTDTSEPAMYARAIAAFRRSDLKAAFAELDPLIAKYPDNPFLHELKGQMLLETADARGAIAPYEKAVSLLPRAPLLRIGLASALVATNTRPNAEEAIRHLQEALAFEPNNAGAWFQLAQAHATLGEEPQAALATAEQYFHVGAPAEAARFARRAIAGLDEGTTQWQRAQDILAVGAEAEARGAQRR